MKQILVMCAVAIAASCFTSCKDTKNNKGQLDPNAMISIRPATGVKAETNPAHLTALEIVQQTASIKFWNKAIFADNAMGRGFSEAQRNYDTPKLLMFGTDIITQDGDYAPDFIEAKDVYLTRIVTDESGNNKLDTIAYVPNKILRDAQKVIKAAYDNEDYTTCYAEFDKAFTFIPITGAEWRALKATGNN